eukprot:s2713_g13.t2
MWPNAQGDVDKVMPLRGLDLGTGGASMFCPSLWLQRSFVFSDALCGCSAVGRERALGRSSHVLVLYGDLQLRRLCCTAVPMDGHDARLLDLRLIDECQRMVLLQAVYDRLLKELHVLLLSETAEPMENLMGCASYEYYPRGNHCLISSLLAERLHLRGRAFPPSRSLQALDVHFAEANGRASSKTTGITAEESLQVRTQICQDPVHSLRQLFGRLFRKCARLGRGVVERRSLVSEADFLLATADFGTTPAALVCCLGCLSLVPGFLRRVVNNVAFFPPRPPGYHVTEDRQVFLVELDYGLAPLPDLASEGIVVDTVRMWTRRGNVILGFHFKRADSNRTLLFSHGNSTDIGIMFHHLRELCSMLHCDVFAYEYSGYGESTGVPTEADIYADIEAAYHYLSNDCSLADDQIVCYGQSIGSVPSVELASRVSVGGLILHSAMKSGLSVIHNVKTTYWFDVFQNATRIKKVTSPVFIIHGTHDAEIPFEHGTALWDACPEDIAYDPWWVQEAGHNDIEMTHRQEYFEKLQAFLKALDRPESFILTLLN